MFCYILLLSGSGYLVAQTTEPLSQVGPYVTDSLLLKIKSVKSAKRHRASKKFPASPERIFCMVRTNCNMIGKAELETS